MKEFYISPELQITCFTPKEKIAAHINEEESMTI